MLFFSSIAQGNASQPTTIAVGQPPNESVTTTITVTPTIGQSVELHCDNGTRIKRWYTTGSEVTPTTSEISTSTGPIRILAFSAFTPSHAGTYTCLASSSSDTQTKTTYPVVLGELLCDNLWNGNNKKTIIAACEGQLNGMFCH